MELTCFAIPHMASGVSFGSLGIVYLVLIKCLPGWKPVVGNLLGRAVGLCTILLAYCMAKSDMHSACLKTKPSEVHAFKVGLRHSLAV